MIIHIMKEFHEFMKQAEKYGKYVHTKYTDTHIRCIHKNCLSTSIRLLATAIPVPDTGMKWSMQVLLDIQTIVTLSVIFQ